jgi:hypothetical protein
MTDEFLKDIIKTEIGGKFAAIHAYDKMMWTVRTGFLTLVFAAWSLVIKSMIEMQLEPGSIALYIYILCAFSLVLALGAYRIDLNYARRKFRVIKAVNQLMAFLCKPGDDHFSEPERNELTHLLQISGDAANKHYRQQSFVNEIIVSRIIYTTPSLLIIGILIYYLIST